MADDHDFFTNQEPQPYVIEQKNHISNHGDCLRWHGAPSSCTPPSTTLSISYFQNHNTWFSAPPLPGGDDQRLSDHACGLRPGEDQGPGHLQQPAAEQEAQEGCSWCQKRIDGLSESVKPGGLMRSKESTGILNLGIYFLLSEGTTAEPELDFSPDGGGAQPLCSSWASGGVFFLLLNYSDICTYVIFRTGLFWIVSVCRHEVFVVVRFPVFECLIECWRSTLVTCYTRCNFSQVLWFYLACPSHHGRLSYRKPLGKV